MVVEYDCAWNPNWGQGWGKEIMETTHSITNEVNQWPQLYLTCCIHGLKARDHLTGSLPASSLTGCITVPTPIIEGKGEVLCPAEAQCEYILMLQQPLCLCGLAPANSWLPWVLPQASQGGPHLCAIAGSLIPLVKSLQAVREHRAGQSVRIRKTNTQSHPHPQLPGHTANQ